MRFCLTMPRLSFGMQSWWVRVAVQMRFNINFTPMPTLINFSFHAGMRKIPCYLHAKTPVPINLCFLRLSQTFQVSWVPVYDRRSAANLSKKL